MMHGWESSRWPATGPPDSPVLDQSWLKKRQQPQRPRSVTAGFTAERTGVKRASTRTTRRYAAVSGKQGVRCARTYGSSRTSLHTRARELYHTGRIAPYPLRMPPEMGPYASIYLRTPKGREALILRRAGRLATHPARAAAITPYPAAAELSPRTRGAPMTSCPR